MAKCGMPTLPLKSENVYAVLMEAFSERASADPVGSLQKCSASKPKSIG